MLACIKMKRLKNFLFSFSNQNIFLEKEYIVSFLSYLINFFFLELSSEVWNDNSCVW